MVAFLFGVLRILASISGTRTSASRDLPWYVLFQLLLSLFQFAIGLLMMIGLGSVLRPLIGISWPLECILEARYAGLYGMRYLTDE
jgi:hypothetical protein